MDQKFGACNKHGCPVQGRNETIHCSEKMSRRRDSIDAGWSLCTAHELNSVADSSKFHCVVLRHREFRAHSQEVTTFGAVTIQIWIASQPTGVACVMASLPCRCSVQQLRLAVHAGLEEALSVTIPLLSMDLRPSDSKVDYVCDDSDKLCQVIWNSWPPKMHLWYEVGTTVSKYAPPAVAAPAVLVMTQNADTF